MNTAILKAIVVACLLAMHSVVNADALLEEVQTKLLEQGYQPGNLLGQWDAATENAIIRFQLENNILPSNGQIDGGTLRALDPTILTNLFGYTGVVNDDYVFPIAGIVPQPVLPAERQLRGAEAPVEERNSIGSLSWNGHLGMAISNADISAALAPEESSVSGGGGLVLGGGIGLHLAESPWGVELGLGYKLDRDSRNGVSSSFQRFPLSLQAFYGNRRYRLGLGLATHISSNFRQSGSASREADSNLGWVASFEYRYRYIGNLSWGVRYENIDYDFSDVGVDRVNGNNVAVYLGWSEF